MGRVGVVGVAAAMLAIGVVPAAASDGPPLDGQPAATHVATRVSPPARSLSVLAVGDLLPEAQVVSNMARTADGHLDAGSLFTAIAPLVRNADLAICHVETPIAAPGEQAGTLGRASNGGALLLGPNELAAGIAATGFDRCSTASNHTNDFGLGGVTSTLDALDVAGLGHAGSSRGPAEDVPHLVTVNGVRVAHLAFTRYSNTGWPAQPWLLDYAGSMDRVVHDVAAARAAGAELVVLSVHIGYELLPYPLPGDRQWVEDLLAATHIDLVIEHGPHVVQPVEVVHGTPVFWSVGNLVSAMGVPGRDRWSDPHTLDGLAAWVRFTETSPGTFSAAPEAVAVCTDPVTRHVYAPSASLGDPSLHASVRESLVECLARTRAVVPSAL